MKAHEIANKEELIQALRWCGSDDDDNEYCVDANYGCPYFKWDKPKDDCKQEMMRDAADALEGAQPEPKWIPCSERLPEEDVKVLISYRYKEGEGDTSHVNVDITTYGQMYFGGREVAGEKHWRPPFEYFSSNYEVIAWMPLPEPWKGAERMKCGYYDRPRTSFPCNKCEYNGKDCLTAKGREPLTCWHCRWWSYEVKPVCHHRKGTSIRPCEHFEWD